MMFIKESFDLDGSTSTLSDSLSNSQHQTKRRKKTTKTDINIDSDGMAKAKLEMYHAAINALQTPPAEQTTVERDGEIDAFGKLVMETLSKFNDRQRVFAKKKINDVLFEIEMGIDSQFRSSNHSYHTPGTSLPTNSVNLQSIQQQSSNSSIGPHSLQQQPSNSSIGPYSLQQQPSNSSIGPYSLQQQPSNSSIGLHSLQQQPSDNSIGTYSVQQQQPSNISIGPYPLQQQPSSNCSNDSVDPHPLQQNSQSSHNAYIDSEFVRKYGKGETYEKECPSCGNKVKLHSAGTHFTESGSIKIYADNDDFECPKCFYTD